MEFLLANLTKLQTLNCVVWSEHALIVEQWIRIFLRSQIDCLLFHLITMSKSTDRYLSSALQADIWFRQIFNTAIVTELSRGIRLEAHGVNASRVLTANELDHQSSNEQRRKNQRTSN